MYTYKSYSYLYENAFPGNPWNILIASKKDFLTMAIIWYDSIELLWRISILITWRDHPVCIWVGGGNGRGGCGIGRGGNNHIVGRTAGPVIYPCTVTTRSTTSALIIMVIRTTREGGGGCWGCGCRWVRGGLWLSSRSLCRCCRRAQLGYPFVSFSKFCTNESHLSMCWLQIPIQLSS